MARTTVDVDFDDIDFDDILQYIADEIEDSAKKRAKATAILSPFFNEFNNAENLQDSYLNKALLVIKEKIKLEDLEALAEGKAEIVLKS